MSCSMGSDHELCFTGCLNQQDESKTDELKIENEGDCRALLEVGLLSGLICAHS